MARQRMAKLIKYGHSEAISCHIMTYFKACQNFMLLTELWRVATSYPWPSDEDLAYTMTSATLRSIEKKLSHSN